MTTPPSPAAGDFELFERTVKLSSGKEVLVREMTLRQRDAISQMVSDLASDQDLEAVMRPLLAERTEGEETAIEVVPILRSFAARVGDGALTRFLAAAVLSSPENRDLYASSASAEEWALDNVRLRDETALLAAWTACNDVAAYLGNLWGLVGAAARLRAETKAPPPAEA